MAIKEFPNNWKAYKDAPDDMFEPHTFEEVMDWKVAGWELPSSGNCLIISNASSSVSARLSITPAS